MREPGVGFGVRIAGVNMYPVAVQIAVICGIGVAVLVLVVAIVLLVRFCIGRAAGRVTTRYVPFEATASVSQLATAIDSTKALRASVSSAGGGSSPRVSNDSAVAAPDIPDHETIGGSGVGYLDERGNPIVPTPDYTPPPRRPPPISHDVALELDIR